MAKQIKALKAIYKDGFYELTWFVGSNKKLWGDILSKVKMIPGRVYDSETKKWRVPINSRVEHMINSIGFRIQTKKVVEPEREKVKTIIPQEYKQEVLRDVDTRLRDYQIDGVKFWQYHNFRALNFDDMGTGKTCQSLSAIRTSQIRPVLIVCPATLKLNFAKEAKMWLNPEDADKVHVVHGMLNMWYKDADLVIINYDMLWKHLEYILREFRPKLVLCDEAHKLNGTEKLVGPWYPNRLKPKQLPESTIWPIEKTVKSNEFLKRVGSQDMVYTLAPQRVRAMRFIVHGLTEEWIKKTNIDWNGLDHILLMTGTPITKTSADVFNLLNFVHKERFKDRDKFVEYFCVLEDDYKKGHKKIVGAKNTDILYKLLYENYAIRRTKKQVLPELPDTIKTVIPLELPKKYREQYDQIENDFVEWVKKVEQSGEEVSDEVKKKRFKLLMDTAMEGKLEGCFQLVDNIINNTNEKVLIFSYNTKIVEAVRDRYEKISVMLNGSTSPTKRQEVVDQFQTDPKIRVFSGQTQAAAEGITLTASHIYIAFQLGWWAHFVQQGIDRLNRMGQKADKVLAYFPQADETIEKYLAAKMDKEQAMIDAIVDGKDVIEEETLTYLWDIYKKKKEK
jgi:SWI/SNF-related matrix-associated actin-dependent regulator 1 of chromatin subfamily A